MGTTRAQLTPPGSVALSYGEAAPPCGGGSEDRPCCLCKVVDDSQPFSKFVPQSRARLDGGLTSLPLCVCFTTFDMGNWHSMCDTIVACMSLPIYTATTVEHNTIHHHCV